MSEPFQVFMNGTVAGLILNGAIAAVFNRPHHISWSTVILMATAFGMNLVVAWIVARRWKRAQEHFVQGRNAIVSILCQLEKDGLVRVEPHALDLIRRDFNSKLN